MSILNPSSLAPRMVHVQAFYKSDLEPVSVWNKLTGQKHRKNAVIEINNLLSERPLLEVSGADVQTLLDRYNLNLFHDFDDGSLRELYKKYLRYCFEDNHLDEAEIERLRHLKRILGLSDKAVRMANHQICREVYERALDDALEDQRIDPKERNFLRNLQERLQLPPALTDVIYHNKAQAIIIDFIKGAVADRQLSPSEEEELRVLIDQLNVHPQWDEKTRAELMKYRLFWQIENEVLPRIFVPLKLRPNEACHFLYDAVWYDTLESAKQSPQVVPDALRHKLANGAYWRNAHPGTIHLAGDAWRKTESGKLYVTSQRLIFRNTELEMIIPLDAVADFDHYQNGILLHRKKGGPIFFEMQNSADIFTMILGRALREM